MFEIQVDLLELRDELVDEAFGTHVDAVEHAVLHRALCVELDVADGHHGLAVLREAATERQAEDVVVAPLHLVFRHEAVDRQRRVVGGLPLESQRAAGALGVLLGIHVTRQAREEGAAAGDVLEAGPAQVIDRLICLDRAGARIVGAAVVDRGALGALSRRGGTGLRRVPSDGRAERLQDAALRKAVGVGRQDVDRRIADLADIARTMPEEFFVEDKFDGIRAQAHVKDGRVSIYSRTMDEISHRFPELESPLKKIPSDVVIDGEIVPAIGERILPFSELQKRLGRKTIAAELLAEVPVILVAYDLLYASGRVLINESLEARLEILASLIAEKGTVRLSKAKRFQEVAALDDEFAAARARGNEGLMVKSPASLYKPGRRGREWLKVKRAIATLDVVVTAVEVGHGKRRHLLSDYTFAIRRSAENAELLNIGKAYSGLTDLELAELTEWFKEHTVREFAHGRVRLVQPEIVIEVTFDRVQESKRHKSGYALRFPRILRLRSDKRAEEIDTLETVQRLVEANSSS